MDEVLKWTQLLVPWAALVVSVASAWFAGVALRKSTEAQKLEFAPRLQLTDEVIESGTPSGKIALNYRAGIMNRGLKPILINQITVELGSEAGSQILSQPILGDTHLAPGDVEGIEAVWHWDSVLHVLKERNLTRGVLRLVVRYIDQDGDSQSVSRPLLGLGDDSLTSYAWRGNALT